MAVAQYRDHYRMIKAIEKCSLQANFGPEITSITELLPKKPDISSEVIHNAIARFNEASLFSAKCRIDTGLLPTDPIDEEGNIPFDHTTNNDGTPVNQNGNIPSERLTNRHTMAAISTHEVPLISFQQSNSFGRIPLEIWRQKVEEARQETGTQRIYRDIHDLSYSNHKHPNHDRLWDSKNLFCMGCTKDTMRKCETCGVFCCFWAKCKEIADKPKAGIIPQELVKGSQGWLMLIDKLMSCGIDEPTFMACSQCGRVLCPKCTSVCEMCDALSCPECCGRCPICQVPKCVRCKPNREDKCSYHRGPPAV